HARTVGDRRARRGCPRHHAHPDSSRPAGPHRARHLGRVYPARVRAVAQGEAFCTPRHGQSCRRGLNASVVSVLRTIEHKIEPLVIMTSDDDLATGEFGIATRMVQRRRRQQGEPGSQPEPAATMIYRPSPGEVPAAEAPEVVRELVTLTVDGQPHEVTKRRTVLGRSRECDIQLADPNVSRRHAELRQEGAAYWIVDLDSTNGTEVNGERTSRSKLEPGDRITVGSTEIVFE